MLTIVKQGKKLWLELMGKYWTNNKLIIMEENKQRATDNMVKKGPKILSFNQNGRSIISSLYPQSRKEDEGPSLKQDWIWKRGQILGDNSLFGAISDRKRK